MRPVGDRKSSPDLMASVRALDSLGAQEPHGLTALGHRLEPEAEVGRRPLP